MVKIEILKTVAAVHEPTRLKFHSIKPLITNQNKTKLSFQEFSLILSCAKETLPDICFPDV